MRKYLPPPHIFRPKTLDSTDSVNFTHFKRTVNQYCVVQLSKCNLKFTGHWLRYSITPNVPTLTTQSPKAINLALLRFAAAFTWSCISSNSDHRIKDFFNKNAQMCYNKANMITI